MVGEGEADRAGGDQARVPITLLGIGAMEVLVGRGGDGVRGRRVAPPGRGRPV